jgi:ion channel
MAVLEGIFGIAMILVILWEVFETIILPRRVTRRFRFSRFLFRVNWVLWKAVVVDLVPRRNRETWLSYYGPLSLLFLLFVWAAGLIVGFAFLHSSAGLAIRGAGRAGFLTDVYFSGTTFFTLGLGDIVPMTRMSRLLTMAESGMGFGFLALVISYLPALNQSFARREVSISLLDARAGSPPSASEMLRRHSGEEGMQALREMLKEWERWSAEFLEGHLSYPVLAYFRSQHDNQSWLGALTAVLDACALIMAGLQGCGCEGQAERTFAMARHAVVDLCLVFRRAPEDGPADRLSPKQLSELREVLGAVGLNPSDWEAAVRKLTELRGMYEPYVKTLAVHFQINLPPWVAAGSLPDNWQVSAWGRDGKEKSRREHF